MHGLKREGGSEMVQMTAWSEDYVMTEVSEELICTVVAARRAHSVRRPIEGAGDCHGNSRAIGGGRLSSTVVARRS